MKPVFKLKYASYLAATALIIIGFQNCNLSKFNSAGRTPQSVLQLSNNQMGSGQFRRQSTENDGQPMSELIDYLISDVCLDVNGNVTKEDPAFCAKKRNLTVGCKHLNFSSFLVNNP